MLVSWKWLSRYVDLSMPINELETRFALSGLNHESTEAVGDDFVIDLEVTSNRGDCLGHIGVAREVAVLYDKQLRTPIVDLAASTDAKGPSAPVENQYPEVCSRYIARMIRGVKIGPSPQWLADSLRSVGINSINNVVDATNYVMLECGQPLHAFDFDKLAEGRIVVRPAADGETIEAIDHHTYTLDRSMCVIADAKRPIAIAGVMGGAATEVTDSTVNLLIEAAAFAPLSVRRTARKLKLASASSYRFERRVDPNGIDWASRRVCELIHSSGGGTVSGHVTDTNPAPVAATQVTLTYSQIKRLLGIEIDRGEVIRILTALGCRVISDDGPGKLAVRLESPSWRHDLTREVDLIEEVARIHGYDKIPENEPIAVAPSAKRPFDVAVEKVRGVMTSAGFCEAMTPSIVTDKTDAIVSPWTDRPSLATVTTMLEGARRLRRSIVPSLLQSRAANWAAASAEADLFEIAHVYLPGPSEGDLPKEQYSLAIVSGQDYFFVKGVVEAIAERLGLPQAVSYLPEASPGLDTAWSAKVMLGDRVVGHQGQVESKLLKELKLPGNVVVAELSLVALLEEAKLVPTQKQVSPFPSIVRDLNLIVAEGVRWSALEGAVRAAVGTELEGVYYRETYRDAKRDGEDRKRILLSVELRKPDSTLTHGEADTLVKSILASCEKEVGAKLLG
jgi:phenylalanyl-tRNA synthetase beta chain